MRNKKKITISFIVLSFLMIILTTKEVKNFLNNGYSIIIDPMYIIPKESSIFMFEATKMNEGSGDWWLYGEDDNYYYALNLETDSPKYFILKKKKKEKKINKFDYKTW